MVTLSRILRNKKFPALRIKQRLRQNLPAILGRYKNQWVQGGIFLISLVPTVLHRPMMKTLRSNDS